MHASTLEFVPDGDIASKFWTLSTSPAPGTSFSARNLYELFVHELSALIAGASQAERAAHTLYACLPPDQIGLRRVVLGLARSSRACLPGLPVTLLDEGLILPPAHDATVNALFSTIHPEACGSVYEPWGVLGTRVVGVFHKVALHLEARSLDAAENALLLGSDALHGALTQWAANWNDYVAELRSREQGFRAQAYAAGLTNTNPCWQTA